MHTQANKAKLAEFSARAKARRLALGLKIPELLDAMKVERHTFYLWERELPMKPRSSEGIWEDMLQVPRGWLRDTGIPTPPDQTLTTGTINLADCGCTTVACEIRCIAAWLSRAARFKRTCEVEELTANETRRATLFAERYGVLGPTTLQGVGDRYGLTRERIRQVVENMVGRVQEVQFHAPCIEALRMRVSEFQPVSLDAFNEQNSDLLGEHLTLEDADRFAREILGIGVAVLSERSFWQAGNAIKRMVHPVADDKEDCITLLTAVRDASRRMIRSCGAAHIMFVTGMVSEVLGRGVSVEMVQRSLNAIEGTEWVAERDGWFWFGVDTFGNRAVDVTKKVMAAAGMGKRLDVEEIQQAICRSRRYNIEDLSAIPPMVELPRHVLCGMLKNVPWLTVVQYDDFKLNEVVPLEGTLSDSELAIYRVLAENGGIASRSRLCDALLPGQMSLVNLQLMLATSPILRHYEGMLYAIRGWEVHPDAMVRARSYNSPGSPQKLMYELDRDGWIQFSLNITSAHLRNKVLDLPISAARLLPRDDYQFDGMIKGIFNIGTHSMPARLSKVITAMCHAGLKEGDVVTMRIHPASRRAIAQLHRADS